MKLIVDKYNINLSMVILVKNYQISLLHMMF